MAAKHEHALTYSVHGLRVRSEIPLTELVCEGTGESDLDISWGESAVVPAEMPEGRLIAGRDHDAGGWALTASATGYTVRFHRECEFRISLDTRAVSVHADPDADPRVASLLLSGNVLALVLELRGACILHASCVQTDALTVAVVGASGMGKSTLASLFCADGARLVSDDALRVELVGGEAMCYPGTGQIRLRPSAGELAESFHDRPVEDTGDERIGISPERVSDGSLRLDAVILPSPSRTSARLEVRRLERRDALIALVSSPRIVSWHVVDPPRRHFDVLARIIEVVPVFEATIPWGPPYPAETAGRLIAALGLSPCRTA